MDSATKGFRYASAAGFVVILISVVISFFYQPSVPNLPPEFDTPILALEFASSLSDASHLFGDDAKLIRKFQVGHQLDMVFLIAYGAFLWFANLAAWRVQRKTLSLIGMICAIIAASADAAENTQLMQLTDTLLGTSSAPDFWLLRLFASTKFLFISASMLCLIPMLWQQGFIGRLYSGASLLLPAATVLTVSGQFQFATPMIIITVLAWSCLLVCLLQSRHGFPPLQRANAETASAHAS
jgi:hypothetical protein